MNSRVIRFEEKLAQSNLDAFLVTGQNNIYYLTGFWGTESTVFITRNRRIFMTDARYTLIAKEVVEGFDIIETRTALAEVSKIIKADQLARVGFDSQVSYAFYEQLTSLSPQTQWLPQTDFVETLRVVKDKSEIETIRQACQISDKAFLDVLDFIKPGQTTELQVANFLDFRMRHYGASGVSFETIAASGYRSAMPHGVASDKIIQSGESLTLDFGCYYKHYVSDMTRTIHIGHVTDEEREIYDIVLRANQTLIDQAKAGMTYKDFDAIPRQVLENAGYGEFFTHGIGHGIGLDIHENPFFRGSEDKLEAGMVVTDEPGIYLPNKYGLRIEDDLVITTNGCEVLTQAPKELIVLK
ncbi:M24 family metallopeptidase [Streptococcus jiangjianxini]|uniref:M24 family metallopeptidase n=1 Tax=Streptococcus jiangjianxini TaxID=3161189 RepID=UPI0032ED7E4D